MSSSPKLSVKVCTPSPVKSHLVRAGQSEARSRKMAVEPPPETTGGKKLMGKTQGETMMPK